MGRVINFHKITDSKWLDDVLRLLKLRYTIISAEQLISYYYQEQPLPHRACLITVDDGDETSYSIIYPILKRYHIPAIFFVSPEKLLRNGKHQNYWFQEVRCCTGSAILMEEIHTGNYTLKEIWDIVEANQKDHKLMSKSQNMTVEQILEIDQEGFVTVGAHTMDHPFLARESDERSEYEIVASIKQLAEILGHPVLTFAYPNGRPNVDFGEREVRTLSHTTCQIAFSTQPKNFSRKDSPYAIPRYGLSCGSIPFIWIKLELGKHYTQVKKAIRYICQIVKHC